MKALVYTAPREFQIKEVDYPRLGKNQVLIKVKAYGVCPEEARITISPYEIFRRELKLIGSFAQTHCFRQGFKISGKWNREGGPVDHPYLQAG